MKTIFLSFTISHSSLTDYFVTLCNKLAKRYRVVVIADKIEEHPFALSPQVTVVKWPSPRPTKLKDFLFLISMIRKYRPSIMVSMFGSVNVSLICGWLCRVPHRIAWNRSLYAKSKKARLADARKRMIYRLATDVFVNSGAVADDTCDYFGVPRPKVRLAYNAVRDPKIFNTGNNPNEIAFVGRLHPTKGIDLLLEAMPSVVARFPDVKLTVAGGYLHGQTIKIYQKKVADLGIGRNVSLVGRLDKNQVVEFLSKSYLSIVPSYLEAFGFVVIESFSVGTPVIGSDSSGVAEIVRDGIDGYHFETGSGADLSEKIISLMSDPDKRDLFSRQCLARFRSEFEVEQATDRVVSIFDQMIG